MLFFYNNYATEKKNFFQIFMCFILSAQNFFQVDTLQREKNCLVREVNEINNKLLETRNALFKAQEENVSSGMFSFLKIFLELKMLEVACDGNSLFCTNLISF